MIKYPNQSNFKKGLILAYNSRLQLVHCRNVKAIRHLKQLDTSTSVSRKKLTHVCLLVLGLLSTLKQPRIPGLGNSVSHSGDND